MDCNDETLDEHEQRQINDGLFSIKALSEMKPETQMQLCAQGVGPYQRGYMRRWAQFVLYGHEKKYHKLLTKAFTRSSDRNSAKSNRLWTSNSEAVCSPAAM